MITTKKGEQKTQALRSITRRRTESRICDTKKAETCVQRTTKGKQKLMLLNTIHLGETVVDVVESKGWFSSLLTTLMGTEQNLGKKVLTKLVLCSTSGLERIIIQTGSKFCVITATKQKDNSQCVHIN